MKANKERAMRQIRGVLRRSKELIADAGTEKEQAAGLAMCEGYLQSFYFSGIISREEYEAFWKEMKGFRRSDGRRKREGRDTA